MDILAQLPIHLAERSRWIRHYQLNESRFGVVYWMRTAVRLDENPALDVAKHVAKSLKQPLLIYHGLSCRYDYASDRHHAFILQAAKDIQSACEDAGLSYVFHLERNRTDQPILKELAKSALLVVTEDMPTDPSRKLTRALAQTQGINLVAVDTACIVPMCLIGKAYERAYEFRNATRRLYAARLGKDWEPTDHNVENYPLDRLKFDSVDFRKANISDLVAQCDIDHSVAPVADTIGGSNAGYTRWLQFAATGLSSYARRRNDATSHTTSRMSAYLHYGMVSPFRVAREAADYKSEGAEKFLDELLIWREMSYAFCFYRNDHDKLSAIPSWALDTLSKHACDSREHLFSWEQLARGETGDELWDAAQRSLLVQGELHNNIRMTWGKSLLKWTSNARSALQMLLDLNHRYALYGRDPNSYGGILWCLGQFDRPFAPEQRIYGTVRTRGTAEHLQRIDLAKYQTLVTTPRIRSIPKIAVIGAGVSGAIAARTLQDHGLEVTVFEKSMKAGGRMATRRDDSAYFDHGAQYFTARDATFHRYVESWLEQGVIQEWHPRIAVFNEQQRTENERSSIRRFVGTPNMRSVCDHLLADVNVRFETRIGEVSFIEKHIHVCDYENRAELGAFDYVISALPAPQAAELFKTSRIFSSRLAQVDMQPCWALLLELDHKLKVDWDAAFVNNSCIRWIARNGTKPNRPSCENVVVHAAFDWSHKNVEQEPQSIQHTLLEQVLPYLQVNQKSIRKCQVHRWRYAISTHSVPERYLSSDRRLIASGDWAAGAKVEGAFLSGIAAAGAVLREVMR